MIYNDCSMTWENEGLVMKLNTIPQEGMPAESFNGKKEEEKVEVQK